MAVKGVRITNNKSRYVLLVSLIGGLISPLASAQTDVAIYQPQNAVEQKAFDILSAGCERCHQEGRLENRLKPAKGFGNVLQLDQLASDPNLLLPGNPDGSRLFQAIVNRDMPYDVYQEGDFERDSPSKEDIAVIRQWITSLGETELAGCRTDVDPRLASITSAIAADIGTLPDHRRANTRYITLTHLAARCASDEEMTVYRQGVAKLLNGLSHNSDVLELETIDKEKTIIRFNFNDLNWRPESWEILAEMYPYGAKPINSQFELLQATLRTTNPFIRGDWFAFFASRPPVYEQILELPDTFAGLQAQFGVDVDANIRNLRAQRAGFQKSGVSRNNRLIERHTISTGAFWTSYDFAGNRERQSLFLYPLGPESAQSVGYGAFQHDGGETIFNLPNGFQAYYLSTADGKRLDKGPTNIVLDPGRRDQSVTNGISCMGCHDNGIRNATDEIRNHATATKSFPLAVREAVAALYPEKAKMDALIESDRKRFQSALRKAGLDPQLKLNGIEITNALSDRYERDVDLELAAAEFGTGVENFKETLLAAGGVGPLLATRLEQGNVPRDQFEAEFSALVERVVDATAIVTDSKLGFAVYTSQTSGLGPVKVNLVANKTRYRLGDRPVFTVRANRNCHLTLINVDSHGVGTAIFPNRFDQDNAILANHDFRFPAADAAFDFAFSTPGKETVIAICDTQGDALVQVTHDFARSAFTDLGSAVYRKIDVVKRKDLGGQTPPAARPSASPVGRSAVKLVIN